jgi:hypothetical protein
MNPRALRNFLTSRLGLFVVFLVVVGVGVTVYGRHRTAEMETAKLTARATKAAALGQMQAPLNQGLEAGVPQEARRASPGEKTNGIVAFQPAAAKTTTVAKARREAAPKPRKAHYSSLLAAYVPVANSNSEPPTPKRFVPFGTLLKCKLVNTVDSANLETPVIAVLLEDVWQNGLRVIPANTLVHGTAKAGRLRDRVTAAGTWHFVWQDGHELAFNGIALDREYDHDIDGYGITDGSAGLKGQVIASDDLQELKMLASAAMSGFAHGTQDRTNTALGTTITGSLSNGVREGVGDVFELYAQRTMKDIEEHGYFVRVPAGKEFYVYVLESVDPQKAKVAGASAEAKLTVLPGSATAPTGEAKTKG